MNEFEKVYSFTEGQLNDLLHDAIQAFVSYLKESTGVDVRGATAEWSEGVAVSDIWEKIDPALHADEEASMN